MDVVKDDVFNALDNGSNIETAIKKSRSLWHDNITEVYIRTGVALGSDIVVEKRSIEDDLRNELTKYFLDERTMLKELSLIEESTITSILASVNEGIAKGLSTKDIQLAIIDSGIVDVSRALRLSRTITGTASSIGQFTTAKMSGATHKKWRASFANVRHEHGQRNNEEVPIDSFFSVKFKNSRPRYPLDQKAEAADRINCRCSMSFRVDMTEEPKIEPKIE